MSAPAGAYRTQSLFARNAANTATIQHLFAILQTDKATMLSTFSLDDIFIARLPDGTDGVIGIVNSNSSNYALHAAARLGCGRKGQFGVFCNDGGLNTLGLATVAYKRYIDHFEGVVFTVTLKSAYYIASTGHGYDYSIDAVYYGQFTYSEAVAADGTITKDFAVQGAQAGQWIHFKGININAEGSYLSPSYSIQVPYLAWSVNGNTTYASQASGGSAFTFYPATYPLDIGTVIYPDTSQGSSNTHINGNYYADSAYWYKLSDNTGSPSTITAMGLLGYWPMDDPNYVPPASDWEEISIVHYSTSETWEDACIVMDGVLQAATTIYLHIPTGVYYASQDLNGGYAPDAIYYTGATAPAPNYSYEFFRLVDGVNVSGGNCLEGPTY